MAELEKASKAAGITYRKGERAESGKYSFSYIPHLVIADGAGKQLHAFEAKSVIEAFKAKKLVSTVMDKAKSFK